MKTAVSVPDEVFRKAEAAAKRLGISRSELYARALRRFLADVRDAQVKASYDAAFDDESAEVASKNFRREAARRALLSVEWDDA